MTDLFSAFDEPERLPIPGAEIYYKSEFDLGVPPEGVLQKLIMETPWKQENVSVWGKTFKQPRLVSWYGDSGKSYHYSGISLDPLPWTNLLSQIRLKVQDFANITFNSVLLNYYRDNNDSMGLHSDDEKELGPNPIIASLSFGAERPFLLKSKTDIAAKPVRIILASGSILLMKGETQKNYKHGIAKQSRIIGPRVNLTFRNIVG